ncbi:unnamed protein product [Closterium sp. Yama58-4]|nr:unnamed protein product [Closterium sp. Yama58-4]
MHTHTVIASGADPAFPAFESAQKQPRDADPSNPACCALCRGAVQAIPASCGNRYHYGGGRSSPSIHRRLLVFPHYFKCFCSAIHHHPTESLLSAVPPLLPPRLFLVLKLPPFGHSPSLDWVSSLSARKSLKSSHFHRRSLSHVTIMATLRTVFILALVLASLPALYAAAAPKQRGDVTAGGSAAVDAAARWGRKLLEASSGAHVDHVGDEEEVVGEVTDDGLDEAVRVLIASNVGGRMKKSNRYKDNLKYKRTDSGTYLQVDVRKASNEPIKTRDCLRCVKPVRVDARKASANAHSSGKGAKGVLQAGGSSIPKTAEKEV